MKHRRGTSAKEAKQVLRLLVLSDSHGDAGSVYGVKTDPLRVVYAARERGADILLYGHTHRPLTDYEDGLHILNPGSLRAGGTYGVVDLSDAGVVLNIVRCRP